MPMLVISERQRAAELQRARELGRYQRVRTREALGVLGIILAWDAFGLVLMGMGMASRSPERGQLLAMAGLSLGYGGMIITLLLYYLRLAERGDL